MDWPVKAFLKASLVWLGAGVSLGVAMAMHPAWTVYRAAHLHMNVLGFVAMMIFGVAYHVIPRFSGHPLHSRRLAVAQWWLANAGLTLFVAGFMALPHAALDGYSRAILATGGTLSAVAAYIFVYNVWRTIDGRKPTRVETPQASGGALQPLLRRSSAR
jgi:cytochrome c oxidase cbb3-type subunit 1